MGQRTLMVAFICPLCVPLHVPDAAVALWSVGVTSAHAYRGGQLCGPFCVEYLCVMDCSAGDQAVIWCSLPASCSWMFSLPETERLQILCYGNVTEWGWEVWGIILTCRVRRIFTLGSLLKMAINHLLYGKKWLLAKTGWSRFVLWSYLFPLWNKTDKAGISFPLVDLENFLVGRRQSCYYCFDAVSVCWHRLFRMLLFKCKIVLLDSNFTLSPFFRSTVTVQIPHRMQYSKMPLAPKL